MIEYNGRPNNRQIYSGPDLKRRILELTNRHNLGGKKWTELRKIYADELILIEDRTNPTTNVVTHIDNTMKIPWEIEPRPKIKFAKQKLNGMTVKEIKAKVLPAYINKDESDEDNTEFMHMLINHKRQTHQKNQKKNLIN